jgi:hypothetical protein
VLEALYILEESNRLKLIFIAVITLFTLGCTTGQLHYVDAEGNRKLGCDVEFVGLPSVDKFAVEYSLSLCAKNAFNRGFAVEQPELLDIDTTIKKPPCGRTWIHELAKEAFKAESLSKREYGYILAHIDLGLATENECKSGDR